ncbi:hypothetical protein BC629DRAFT_1441422 [Irpex lacteus]|nr:hypothetical protein BC629DRAFT_1441422 [Irpex lacteus]
MATAGVSLRVVGSVAAAHAGGAERGEDSNIGTVDLERQSLVALYASAMGHSHMENTARELREVAHAAYLTARNAHRKFDNGYIAREVADIPWRVSVSNNPNRDLRLSPGFESIQSWRDSNVSNAATHLASSIIVTVFRSVTAARRRSLCATAA